MVPAVMLGMGMMPSLAFFFLYGSVLLALSPAWVLKCYIPPRDQYIKREHVRRKECGGEESWQHLVKKQKNHSKLSSRSSIGVSKGNLQLCHPCTGCHMSVTGPRTVVGCADNSSAPKEDVF